MPTGTNLAAFVLASAVLAVTPGPGVAFLLARTVAEGRRAGLLSVLGVALGNLASAWATGLGLSGLFTYAPRSFDVLRFIGAGYLIFLGVLAFARAFRETKRETAVAQPSTAILRDSFFVALTNPKTMLFFTGFIPQFFTPGESVLSQWLVLGLVFAVVAACSDTVYVLAAGVLQKRLGESSRTWRILACVEGSVFVALGVLAIVWGARIQT